MIIKTSEGEKNVASKGLGGTALGLSIGALGLELLRGGVGNCGNGCGNGGILGNLFGGNCGNNRGCGNYGCHTGCYGEYDCVTPVCRPWQYEDKIICLEDRNYTNEAVACAVRPLYEKIERIEKKEAYEAGYEAAKKEDVPVIEVLKTKLLDCRLDEKVPFAHYVACGKKLVDPCYPHSDRFDRDDRECGECRECRR